VDEIRPCEKEPIEIIAAIPHEQFFRVGFIKRTTGKRREFTCRRGVKKHLRGGSLPYDPKKKQLLPVWIAENERRDDGKDNGYRTIPLDGIYYIKTQGREYFFPG